jgi:hypothetical protein
MAIPPVVAGGGCVSLGKKKSDERKNTALDAVKF